MNILFIYGMESAYFKFASTADGRDSAQRVFSTVVWSLLATSILFSVILLAVRGPFADLINVQRGRAYLLAYVVAIMSLDALAIIPFAEIRLQNRSWRFATIKLLNIGVNIGLNLWLILGLRMGIEAIFIANLCASALALLLLTPEIGKLLRPMFDRSLWKEVLRFGLPFLPSGLAYVLAERSSIFFLGKLSKDEVIRLYGAQLDLSMLAEKAAAAAEAVRAEFGALLDPAELVQRMADATDLVYGQEVMGVFNGMYKLSIAMMLISQMFRYAWQPFFLQHATDQDARQLFARVFTFFSAVAFFVLLSVSFFAAEIVAFPIPFVNRTLIPDNYWMALNIIPLALLAYVFQGWYYNFSAAVYIEKKTRYLIHCTAIAGAVSLVLNILLVPRFGMLGAVWAIALAFAAMATALYLITRRFYPVPYHWKKVGGIVGMAAVAFALWSFVPAAQQWWIELLLLATYAGVLFLLGVIRPADVRILKHRQSS
jgi:O-antigen/teichoic acid export membrane protein